MLRIMPVSAVLLDVGGVLVVANEERLYDAMVAAGLARPSAAMIEAHYRVTAAIDLVTHAPEVAADTAAFARLWAGELGVGDDPEAIARYERAFLASQPLWESVLPWAASGLAALRDAGYRLGIVSNADGTVEQSLRTIGLCQVGPGAGAEVEVVVDSFLVGVAKPDPAIFAIALDAMGLEPADCVYVGDTIRYDIDGARATGMQPIHLDPYTLCSRPHDHDHVTDLGSVVDLLGARP